MIDADTIASAGSFEAALHAAGGAVDAAERLLGGEDSFAFCGLRPPGHHAERARAMGFCLFNNVAVAARHAIEACGAERVLVLDWDVHHGNGTEAIFAASDEVLYASIHQWPLYPGTGARRVRGDGEGEGFTVNLPVPAGRGRRGVPRAGPARGGADRARLPARAARDLGRLRRPPATTRSRTARWRPRDYARDGRDDARAGGASSARRCSSASRAATHPTALAASVLATIEALERGPRARRGGGRARRALRRAPPGPVAGARELSG